MSDPRSLAQNYLTKHKIPEIFEILGSKLAMLKPDDPNAFILAELSKMSAMKGRGETVTLFDESDIKTLFAIFDITGKGFVSKQQYLRALNYVGIDKPSKVPVESIVDQLDEATFVKNIVSEINSRGI